MPNIKSKPYLLVSSAPVPGQRPWRWKGHACVQVIQVEAMWAALSGQTYRGILIDQNFKGPSALDSWELALQVRDRFPRLAVGLVTLPSEGPA